MGGMTLPAHRSQHRRPWRRSIARVGVGVATAALGLAAVATPALAASSEPAAGGATPTTNPQRLADLQGRCEAAIDRRLTFLDGLTNRANGAQELTSAHRATILSTITSQRGGLASLRNAIAADATVASALADCRKIVPDYRVYVLTGPKVHLTIAADRLLAAAGKLDDAEAKLQQAATTEQGQGKDVSAAQAKIDDMKAQDAAIRSKVSGVGDALLALEPSGYPANQGTVTSSRDAVVQARGDAQTSFQDAKAAKQALNV